jgi:VWFA-related protein
MRVAVNTIVLAGTLCAAAVPLTAGQDPPAAVFRSESDLVVVHVNVFDGRSDAVPNLPQTAFQILEDDKPQTITFFSNEDVPVAVGLVLDNSGSMITRRKMVLAGARIFAESSHPEDEVFTIVFNEHVRLGLPEQIAFTQNALQLQASITRFVPGGKTALHDAVVAGLEHLQEATHQKRVLIVLSDGEDNASRHSEENMLERALRSDTIIYTVSTADLDTNVGKPRLLKKLAELSGGAAYTPESEAEVVEAFRTVAENIRRGYSVGYVPTNSAHDGRFRRVKVTVRAPGYRNLNVSARDGYLAPRHDDAN